MIQDAIMAACGVMFFMALVPQIVVNARERRCGVSLWTSAPTALGLGACAACGFTLGLWNTAMVWTATALAWAFIAAQRIYFPSTKGAGQ